MKKLLIALVLIFSSPIIAEMRYDLVAAKYYSYPQAPEINQAEYLALLMNCAKIECRIIIINGYAPIEGRTFLNQDVYYLNTVGSPTALRLIEDLKKNIIYYSDGSFWRKIWSDL